MNLRRTALGLATAALISPVALASTAQAAARPDARPDKAAVTVGKQVVVNVLGNDVIAKKPRAKVSIVARAGLGVRVDAKRRLVVKAPARAVAKVYRVVYKVTDYAGRIDKAVIRVVVKAAPNGPTLHSLVKALPVAAETRAGYDRDLFKHWNGGDVYGDGCDTRREVLLTEAVTKPAVGSSCSFTGGEWFSYYDGVSVTDAGSFDIDHMVPLAEAWDSGAYGWDDATREEFANDQGDPRSLVAVTASSNRSKSDQDPAEWMPPSAAVHCRYVTEWVAVKVRWSLKVDSAEKSALWAEASKCPDSKVVIVSR